MILARVAVVLATLLGADEDAVLPIGRLSDATIRETSGIVASREHRGIFWIVSDSGNPATIHAIDRTGRVVAEFAIAAANVDWEEITTDDAGHLLICDIGNNGHRLPIRAIYRIDEPDPARPSSTPIRPGFTTFYGFPSRRERFDAEGMFVDGNHAVLISKRLDGGQAEWFTVSMLTRSRLTAPDRPTARGKIPGFREPVTGASLSRDGRRLAVAATDRVRIYERAPDGGLTLAATVRYKKREIEAVTWDGPDLIMAAETGELFLIPAGKLRR